MYRSFLWLFFVLLQITTNSYAILKPWEFHLCKQIVHTHYCRNEWFADKPTASRYEHVLNNYFDRIPRLIQYR